MPPAARDAARNRVDRFLDASTVRETVSISEVIEGLRTGFGDLAAGHFEMPPRAVLRDGQFLVMPVAHIGSGSAIVKTLSLNFARTPPISGTVVWSELDRPDTLVADAAAITTLRTGAATGLATDVLADPHARTLTLFGAGAQAAEQVRAVHAVRPLAQVTVVARRPNRAQALVDVLAAELPHTRVVAETDVGVALDGADVVCCATRATAPLFSLAHLPERVHVNAIGAYRPDMHELPQELLADALVVVDDRAAVLAESGEVIDAVRDGVLTEAQLLPLGAALTEFAPQRAGRTVFKSVGVAMQDWVVAKLLADQFFAKGQQQ